MLGYMMGRYRERVVDAEVARALRISSAVNIVGPRACGKTTTANRVAASRLVLDDSDANILAQARLSPPRMLEGEEPRLLDEWQLVPELWGAVRREVDRDNRPGRFLMSGSAWPDDDARRHSGAGRIVDLRMRPMSLWESGQSTGELSLNGFAAGEPQQGGVSSLTVARAAEEVVRGGWPGWLELEPADAAYRTRAYLNALSQRDFPLVAGSRRAPERLLDFVRAYSSLTAHPAPLSTVGKRLADEGVDVGRDYPGLFHDFASRLFLVEDQPAWSPGRRSRTRLVASPKRHLVDPSLAAASMGMSADGLMSDPETFGYLFESMVVRDLRVYAQAGDANVLHYRTHDAASEVDAIVEYSDGRWLGVEVKLGYAAAEEAADRLLRTARAINREPTALLVVVPDGPAVQLPNGVWIAPLGLLGP